MLMNKLMGFSGTHAVIKIHRCFFTVEFMKIYEFHHYTMELDPANLSAACKGNKFLNQKQINLSLKACSYYM